MHRCLLALLCLGGLSFSQIQAPQVGFLRNANSQIIPVSGLAASFVVGKPLPIDAVVSSNFSGQAGVVLQRNRLLVLDASGVVVATYPEGDVTGKTGVAAGIDTAIAWLPATRNVVWYNGSQFQDQQLPADLPGLVLGIRRNQNQALLLLEDNGAVSEASVSLTNGNLLNLAALPGRVAPAAYLGTQVLSSEQLDDLPCSAASIESASASWAHVSCTDGRQWAVHLQSRLARASELPGSQIRKLTAGTTQERRQ